MRPNDSEPLRARGIIVKYYKEYTDHVRLLTVQGPVVRKVDNAIHWINLYPVDNAIDFPNTYPLYSELSDG